jgi:hypothetical protein
MKKIFFFYNFYYGFIKKKFFRKKIIFKKNYISNFKYLNFYSIINFKYFYPAIKNNLESYDEFISFSEIFDKSLYNFNYFKSFIKSSFFKNKFFFLKFNKNYLLNNFKCFTFIKS